MKLFTRAVVATLLIGSFQFAHISTLALAQTATRGRSNGPAYDRLDRNGGPIDIPGGQFFFSQAVNFQPGNSFPLSIYLADVNGDGNLDVVVANQDQATGVGSVSVFLGNGDGTLQPPVSYDTGAPIADSVFVIDVNNDGLPDIVVANQNTSAGHGVVSVLWNAGGGTFMPAVTYDTGGPYANSVFVMDVNNDGLPDIVVAN